MTMIDTAKIGRKGGNARAANLSDEELSESASAAARARWAAYYKLHPDKLKTKMAKAKKTAKKKKA
jgi:hypothetical protein